MKSHNFPLGPCGPSTASSAPIATSPGSWRVVQSKRTVCNQDAFAIPNASNGNAVMTGVGWQQPQLISAARILKRWPGLQARPFACLRNQPLSFGVSHSNILSKPPRDRDAPMMPSSGGRNAALRAAR